MIRWAASPPSTDFCATDKSYPVFDGDDFAADLRQQDFVHRTIKTGSCQLRRNRKYLSRRVAVGGALVPKNIIIFSDGTGQRGGILFDECRSNIYKLFRATRCGPDSSIDPSQQLTYYDPGIGSAPSGLGGIGRSWRKLHNLISQATGLGLTTNIVECYTALLQMWEPGDRIFLFGFSRGAYTVRCLAAVIGLCGIPRVGPEGKALRRDRASCYRLAKEAVKDVYQHVGSPKDERFIAQRKALAERYRNKYRAEQSPPYFIGVFDTVAAVGLPGSFLVASALLLLAIGTSAAIVQWLADISYLQAFAWSMGVAVLGVIAALIPANLKWARGLKGIPAYKTIHFTKPWLRFYDNELNPRVGYARHAIALDETRASFECVPWTNARATWPPTRPGEPVWLKQCYFPGNHADIGGGYPENESRLSDIALLWMVQQAQEVPYGILVDPSVLQLYADYLGAQHDERGSILYRFSATKNRTLDPIATVHDSVLKRMNAPEVRHADTVRPYRPYALRKSKIPKRFDSWSPNQARSA